MVMCDRPSVVTILSHQLRDRQLVVGLDLVKQRQGVVLNHLVLRAHPLGHLVDPSPHHLQTRHSKIKGNTDGGTAVTRGVDGVWML